MYVRPKIREILAVSLAALAMGGAALFVLCMLAGCEAPQTVVDVPREGPVLDIIRLIRYAEAKDINTLTEEVEAIGGVVIVNFYADWCGPCRLLAPELRTLAMKKYQGKVTVLKVNVDNNQGLARDFEVRGIPVMFFFYEGRLVKFKAEDGEQLSIKGYRSADELSVIVDELLAMDVKILPRADLDGNVIDDETGRGQTD